MTGNGDRRQEEVFVHNTDRRLNDHKDDEHDAHPDDNGRMRNAAAIQLHFGNN